MYDLTITQASKPDWQIEMRPLIVVVSEAFVRGEKEFNADVNGCLVIYKAFPADRAFEKSPLWTDKGRISALAKGVMAKL
jgi:hypothetical protein